MVMFAKKALKHNQCLYKKNFAKCHKAPAWKQWLPISANVIKALLTKMIWYINKTGTERENKLSQNRIDLLLWNEENLRVANLKRMSKYSLKRSEGGIEHVACLHM